MSAIRRIGAGLALLLLADVAAADPLPYPLLPADPAKPLQTVADLTWSGAQLQARRLTLPPFTYDPALGPVHLVLDYATAAPSADGSGLIEVGIECPEADRPCAVPLPDTVVGFRGSWLGELQTADGALWATRESRSYRFAERTRVDIELELKPHERMPATALRARLVYGAFDTTPLAGQATRSTSIATFAALVGLGLLAVWWWLRR